MAPPTFPRLAVYLVAGTAVVTPLVAAGALAADDSATPAEGAAPNPGPAGETGGGGAAAGGTNEADLRHQLEIHSPFFDAATGNFAWKVVPAVDVMGTFTDNILQTHSNRRWDVGTAVTPSVAVIGNTPNTQLRLFYAPTVQLYARTPQENSLTQSLNGYGSFTVIPDTFHVYASAYAGVGSTTGFGTNGLGYGTPGFTPNASGIAAIGVSRQTAQQIYSVSVTPTAMHRFGDAGILTASYSASETIAETFPGSFLPSFGSGGTSQHSFSQQEQLQFVSGEALGRWSDVVLLYTNQTSGSGQLGGATSSNATNQVGYALNQYVTVSGMVGYQEQRYPGAQGASSVNYSGIAYQASTTLTPNPDSQITLGYGRNFNVSGPYVNAWYALTARTTVSANYSASQTTNLQSTQNQVALGQINQYGNFVNRQTGAPLVLGANNGLGIRPGVYKTKTLGVGSTTTYDRDWISVNLTGVSQQAVSVPTAADFNFGGPVPTVGSTDTSWTVSTYWSHSYNPDLSGTVGVYYTNSSYPGRSPSRSDSLGTTFSWQYIISPNLTGYFVYNFYSTNYSLSAQNVYVDTVIIGLHRSF